MAKYHYPSEDFKVIAELLNKNQQQQNNSQIILYDTTPFLKEFLALLEANYTDYNFDVNKICQLLSLCSMQVHRKVKKHTGLSPASYLLRFRIAKALNLLNSTNNTIHEIALQTGFKYQSTFTRAFSRVLKCPPLQVRLNQEDNVINWQKKVDF